MNHQPIGGVTIKTIDLRQAKNIFGGFNPDCRERIEEYVNNQNTETWDNCCHIIIGGKSFLTIWQAVCDLDPSFPRRGRSEDFNGKMADEWKQIPSIELFERAIRYGSR